MVVSFLSVNSYDDDDDDEEEDLRLCFDNIVGSA